MHIDTVRAWVRCSWALSSRGRDVGAGCRFSYLPTVGTFKDVSWSSSHHVGMLLTALILAWKPARIAEAVNSRGAAAELLAYTSPGRHDA